MAVAASVLLTGAAPVQDPAQKPLLTPSHDEVYAHVVELIAPVRRPGANPFDVPGVPLILTIDVRGEVIGVEVGSFDDGRERPSAEVIAEAMANARGARFEPFIRDGVPAPAQVKVYVGVQPPERRPERRVPFPAFDGQDVVIGLKRTACFGTCPSYTVEILGDGRVTYTGEAFVAVEGVHHGRIPREAVEALVERFRAADFFWLEDEYVAGITDSPSYTVTLVIGGRTKRVVDYVGEMDGMPFAVTRLEEAIDRAAGTRAWVDGDATTAGRLEAEGYDFTSLEAGRALIWMVWEESEAAALDFTARGAPLIANTDGGGFGARRTALEGAAFNGSVRLTQALIDRGGLELEGAAEAALIAAARSRDLATLETVLGAARFNREQLGHALAATMNQPNWNARERDPAPVNERLLALHADVNAVDSQGRTPLHGASAPEMVRRLIALGADLEAKDEEHGTPLANVYDEDVALALLDAGADPTARSEYDDSLREKAEEHGWTRVLARLGEPASDRPQG
jgi:ankyrin repeat protein